MHQPYAPDPREAKLPKWVQQDLFVLRSNLESARSKLHPETIEGCDTWIQEYGPRAENANRPIGKGTTIQFDTADGPLYVQISNQGESIEVYSPGGGGVVVRPWVTNVIHVGVDHR